MFAVPFVFVFYAFLAYLGYQLFCNILRKRHNARQAKKLGCLPPPHAPNKGLWGINILRESIKATKQGWGPVWMHQSINAIGKDVHTVRAPVFDYELLITRDIENMKAVFNSQSADFDVGPHRIRTFKSAFGLGLMTAIGSDWKHSRGLIRPQFARHNVANLAMFEKHVQCLMKRLKPGADSWSSTIDMQPMFQNFTLDTGTEFLYGQSVYSQDPEARAKLPISWDPNAPDIASFGAHVDEVKRILDRQGALAKYSWLARDSSFSAHVKALNEFVDYFVHKTLSQTDEEKRIETSSEVQGRFVLLEELAKETRDPVELRSETLNVLIASRDTTAALMGWVVYFLARHPAAFAKLRAEIMSRFENKDYSNMSFNELWQCHYMIACLNESIRVAGVVPMNERYALRDTTIPRGGGPNGNAPVFVPKGQQILLPTYSLQHREDIWGSDAEEWKPERWEGRKFGWDFIPFGAGIRQCIGQQFARTETMYLLVRLLQKYDKLENMEPPGLPIKFHHTIENRSGTGVQVRWHAISKEEALIESEDYFDAGFEPERKESVGL